MRQLLDKLSRWAKSPLPESTEAASAASTAETPDIQWAPVFESPSHAIRQQLMAWQDHWVLELPVRWLGLYEATQPKLKQLLENMGMLDQVRQDSFREKTIQPFIQAECERFRTALAQEIQVALNQLQLSAAFSSGNTLSYGVDSPNGLDAGQLARAGLPMVAASAAVPIALKAGVVSAGGLLGLFGATTIAWPVVVGGVVVASGLSAAGIINTKQALQSRKDNFAASVVQQLYATAVYAPNGQSCAQHMQADVVQLAQGLLNNLPRD